MRLAIISFRLMAPEGDHESDPGTESLSLYKEEPRTGVCERVNPYGAMFAQ